jgi:hypoxanthine phosphoribosyltransferase
MSQKFYVTYNQVHKLCQQSADAILKEFHPNLMIAIGGGGYVPARILRYDLDPPQVTCMQPVRRGQLQQGLFF